MNVADVVDAALELPVAPSFTRLGFHVRRRLERWEPLAGHRLDGRAVVVTGATSGLGRAATAMLARLGATVVAVGRDAAKLDRLVGEQPGVVPEVADLSDLDAVRALAGRLAASPLPLDTLIHNAGALLHERTTTAQGLEVTVATQVVAPFLLTHALLDSLTTPARILTMSSGGMYAAPLEVERLQMAPDSYDGTRQYALAKRAQVTLNEMWAERVGGDRAVFGAVHPGWADTPGVAESLPTFRRVVGPGLRTPEEGADTIVWLAAADGVLSRSGAFWLDRRVRPIHRLPSTRRSDTADRRGDLWRWVAGAAGVDPTE